MRLSYTCNLLRASGGFRVLWDQTNRAGCDQQSLRVLVSCFERFFVSFEMHLTRSLDSNLFAPADALFGDRNWRAEHDHAQACRILIRSLDPERAVKCAILNRFAHMLRRDLSLAIEIGDGARNFQNPVVSAGA